jgi:SAM-dependent methyltransferase
MPDDAAFTPRGSLLWRALRWNPWVRRLGKSALSRALQLAPRVRVETERPAALDPAAVLARTDELNRMAERYFAEYPDPEFILGKPFTDERDFPLHLFELGVLFHFLRVTPDDVVLEFGAGTCWVSHFLNRFGCKTISVDVSATALRLGRTLFERDSRTRWDVEPEFLVYDGHHLPLPTGACNRIVVNDAFHHVPNPEEILREMARVLTHGGIVVMAEPGAGHAQTGESLGVVEATGVLENEIVLQDLDAMARRAGFEEPALVSGLSLMAAREMPVSKLGSADESGALLEQWNALHNGRRRYIVLHKGPWVPTTRHPEALDARIQIVTPRDPLVIAAGETIRLRVQVVNRGDTRWLSTATNRRGWTRLGVHLYRDQDEVAGRALDFDWHRVSLPRDLDPGEEATVDVELPLLEPGAYRLVFDLVAEQVCWFAERGSPTVTVPLTVAATSA